MKKLSRRMTRKLLMREFKSVMKNLFEEPEWSGRSPRERYDELMDDFEEAPPVYDLRDIGAAMHFLNILKRSREISHADAVAEFQKIKRYRNDWAERKGLDMNDRADAARVIAGVHEEMTAMRTGGARAVAARRQAAEREEQVQAAAREEVWEIPGDTKWDYAKIEDVWHTRRRGSGDDWKSLEADRFSGARDKLDSRARRRG